MKHSKLLNALLFGFVSLSGTWAFAIPQAYYQTCLFDKPEVIDIKFSEDKSCLIAGFTYEFTDVFAKKITVDAIEKDMNLYATTPKKITGLVASIDETDKDCLKVTSDKFDSDTIAALLGGQPFESNFCYGDFLDSQDTFRLINRIK